MGSDKIPPRIPPFFSTFLQKFKLNFPYIVFFVLILSSSDCDRRTEQAKKRLAETQEELSAEAAAKASIVNELGEQIGVTLAKVR